MSTDSRDNTKPEECDEWSQEMERKIDKIISKPQEYLNEARSKAKNAAQATAVPQRLSWWSSSS